MSSRNGVIGNFVQLGPLSVKIVAFGTCYILSTDVEKT